MTETTDEPRLTGMRYKLRRPLLKRAYRAFVNYWRGTTTRLNVLIGAAFVLLGFLLVYTQIDTLNQRDQEQLARETAQSLYQAEIVQYVSDVNAYALCVDGVSRSDNNRSQWLLAVDVLREIGAEVEADRLAAGPLLASAPRTIEDCDLPGDRPTAPGG